MNAEHWTDLRLAILDSCRHCMGATIGQDRSLADVRLSRSVIKMKVVVSNLPDGADFGWVVEQMHKMLGDEIIIEQTEA